MPPRKRRPRRKTDILPDLEPTPAPAPEPAPVPQAEPMFRAQGTYTARLTRATQEEPETLGFLLSRRPADAWRGRMSAAWWPAGDCPTCQLPRYLLKMTGTMAVCDLREELVFLRAHGACTCSYAQLERTPNAYCCRWPADVYTLKPAPAHAPGETAARPLRQGDCWPWRLADAP